MAVVVYGMPSSSRRIDIFWPFGVVEVRSSRVGVGAMVDWGLEGWVAG